MNIKSFFNGTVFKKDLSRFLPMCGIYLIAGVLMTISSTGSVHYLNAQQLADSLPYLSLALCIYSLVTALLIFGELLQSRMCNAIHAFPLRREGLFLSHYAAGILIGIVPNVIIALVNMMSLGSLWYVALLWLAAMAMMYLIFFSIAVFCILCSGNFFSAVGMYALVNLVALLAMRYFELFYLPMLYGLDMRESLRLVFRQFSPVSMLVDEMDWLIIEHAPDCPVFHDPNKLSDPNKCLYIVTEYSHVWGYLSILTPISGIFAIISLLLHRKRPLESAGEFAAFRPVELVFAFLSSVCIGDMFYHIMGETYIGLAIGLAVGFFGCRMLLDKSLKIFGKKTWLQLTAFCLALALSLGLTYFDVCRVENRVPKAEDVQSVTIASNWMSEWELEEILAAQSKGDPMEQAFYAKPFFENIRYGCMTLTETQDIDAISQIHRLLIEEGDASTTLKYPEYKKIITILYQLKNGTSFTRYYHTALDSPAMQALKEYTNQPLFILGHKTVDEMSEHIRYAMVFDNVPRTRITDPELLAGLAQAPVADAAAGHLDGSSCLFNLGVQFSCNDLSENYFSLTITEKAGHTLAWLREYNAWCAEHESDLPY
jgi:hypothetical protein